MYRQPLDISLGTRLNQLNDVVNELLSNEDPLPYLFTLDNVSPQAIGSCSRCPGLF